MRPRRLITILTTCLAVSAGAGCSDDQTGLQLSQWGITFTLDGASAHGQFANGDWWVVGPVTLTAVDPAFDGAHHGWESNPADTEAQGYDARIADFDAGRVPALPYQAQPGSSIVKGISLEPLDDADCRPCMRTAAVLTVMAEAPPDDGRTVFRPPYFGGDKPLYSTTALRTELLPSLAAVGEPPALDETYEGVRRVQLDHKIGWTGRPLHPADDMPDYGSSIASRNAVAALRSMLDDPLDDKMDLLVAYVQMGIDIIHMARGGVQWPPGGGHGEGRKLPAVMAAVLLGDAALQDEVSGAARESYGENGGMYASQNGGQVLFGQTPNSEEAYWTNLVFDTGSRTIIDPYQSIDGGHEPGGSYQFCCTSLPWKATAAALRAMPPLIEVWNHQAFFDYVDRWVGFGAWTQPDACAPPTGVCAGGDNPGAACTTASAPQICTGQDASCDATVQWDADYGVRYGPDGAGGCIADAEPSDGMGRFPQLHGASTDDGHYGNAFADAMWTAYAATP